MLSTSVSKMVHCTVGYSSQSSSPAQKRFCRANTKWTHVAIAIILVALTSSCNITGKYNDQTRKAGDGEKVELYRCLFELVLKVLSAFFSICYIAELSMHRAY